MRRALIACLLAAGLGAQDPSDDKIKGWVEQLAALYETERVEARRQLKAAGPSAEKRLVEGLDHADHRVRRGCLELLALINAPSGVERASALFLSKMEDRAVQAAAFEYLKLHGQKAEDLFIEALDNPDEAVRIGAIETLTGIKSAKALPKAAGLFDKESVKAVKERLFLLLKAGGEPARPHLIKLMANPDAQVRQEALAALISMQTPPEDLVEAVAKMLKLEVNDLILKTAFDVFARAGDKATPHLLEGLRSPSAAVREKALDAVKKEKTEGALEGVAELYHRETVDGVRAVALEYLIEQGLRSEAALIKALDSPLAKVRMEAIPALGQIKSEKVFDRVAALYKNEKDPQVRKVIFKYLESVGMRAEGELIAAMKDEDPSIRGGAIRALGAAQSEKAIGPMIEQLKDDKSPLRAILIEALAAIGEKAIDQLQAGVKAQKVAESDANDVIILYNQIAVERVFDGMISENGQSGTFAGQFEALAKLGRDRVLPVLWKMATDADYVVRSRDSQKLPPRYASHVQCLALLAIGELGDASALKKLQELSFQAGEDRHREQLVALHRLGDKAPLEKFVASELKEGRSLLPTDDRGTGYDKLFNAGLLQARVGSKDEALKTYVELVAAVEKAKQGAEFLDYASAYYNIACLHAGAGRKSEAVTALTRAIEAGWEDYDWIFKDRDLDPIRGEEGYKKLTAEAEKSRKK